MGIASEIILGLVNAGASLLTGYMQNETLDEGQREARILNERQINLQAAQNKTSEKLQMEQLKLQKKQLKENTRLTEKQMGIQQEQYARQNFRDQVSRLTSILEGNENLKSLYINRLSSLRN